MLIAFNMRVNHTNLTQSVEPRIFALADWEAWLDRTARTIFGVSGKEFEKTHCGVGGPRTGPAEDLASVVELIRRLRR
jgi:hypothetical protein